MGKKLLSADSDKGIGEGVACSKRWHVTMMGMHHERKASERLARIGIESLIPVRQELHQLNDHQKVVGRVLIPMMDLVHADQGECMKLLILSSSVSRYMALHEENTPAITLDDQITHFYFMPDCSDKSVCIHTSPLARGEDFCVVKRSLKGLVGEVITEERKKRCTSQYLGMCTC